MLGKIIVFFTDGLLSEVIFLNVGQFVCPFIYSFDHLFLGQSVCFVCVFFMFYCLVNFVIVKA